MKVLVTGGTGYLGSAIVGALARRGHEPIVFSRRASSSGPQEAAHISGDVTDRATLLAATRGVDAVCHTAALVSVWRPDPADFDRVNVGGPGDGDRCLCHAGNATYCLHVETTTRKSKRSTGVRTYRDAITQTDSPTMAKAVAWMAEVSARRKKLPALTRGTVKILQRDWPLDSARSVQLLGYRVTPPTLGIQGLFERDFVSSAGWCHYC